MEHIVDMRNYVKTRQDKGKTPAQVRDDLIQHGYDSHAAHGLVMMYWRFDGDDDCQNPECPDAGKCDGQCAKEF